LGAPPKTDVKALLNRQVTAHACTDRLEILQAAACDIPQTW